MSSADEDNKEQLEINLHSMFFKGVLPLQYQDPPSNSTILQAVKLDDTEKVQQLISVGESLNVTDVNGNTVLHLAVMKGSNKMVQLLLKNEVNIDHQNFKGNTPLLLALKYNSIRSIILQLLEANCNVNIKNNNENSALHIAVKYSKPDIMQLLIKHAADINAQNRCSRTPLHNAVERNNLTALCMLLYYNADTKIQCVDGLTPFVYSILYTDVCEMTDILFPYYNEVTHVNSMGETAFNLALIVHHPIVYELINAGIECGYSEDEATDALDYALNVNDINLFKLILNQISDYPTNILVDYKNLFSSVLTNYFIPISTSLNYVYLLVELSWSQNIPDCNDEFGKIWLHICKYLLYFNIDSDTRKRMLLSILSLGVEVNSIDLMAYCHWFGNGDEIETLYLNHVFDSGNYNEIPPLIYFKAIFKYNDSLVLKLYLERSYYKYLCDVSLCYAKMYDGLPVYLGYMSISHEVLLDLTRHLFAFVLKDSILYRLSLLPNVPSLLELSRNAAALHFVSKFNIKHPYQFIDIINRANIPKCIKDLLLFRKPVYNI